MTTESKRDDGGRDAFERWYVGALVTQGAREIERNANGDYILMQTRLAWQAWHAGWLDHMPELGADEPKVSTDGVGAGCAYPGCCANPRAYTDAIGQAGEDYHRQFRYAHPLPALWRWSELWDRMNAAAGMPASEPGSAQ